MDETIRETERGKEKKCIIRARNGEIEEWINNKRDRKRKREEMHHQS